MHNLDFTPRQKQIFDVLVCQGNQIRFVFALIALWFSSAALAQITAAPGYAIKRLDGKNVVGSHFAVTPAANSGQTSPQFFYLEDRQALYSAICFNGECNVNSTALTGTDRGKYVSSALVSPPSPGGTQIPLVAYYDATNGDLRLGRCSFLSCSNFASDSLLVSGGDTGLYTAITVNPATGFAVISYYSQSLGDLGLYVCADATCTTGSVQTLATANDVGQNSALAFGANLANFTNLFAVYDDVTLGQVLFSRTTAPFAMASTISLGVGSDAAISVGGSGFPDIVYRGLNNALTHVRCLTFDCVAANQAVQSLGPAQGGFAPSITRLPNGNAFITAFNQATNTLTGYVCNDATCSAPQVLSFESRAGLGPVSVASVDQNAKPQVYYQDSLNAEVRSADCTTTACTAVQNRLAANGLAATLPDFALRTDGRAVAIWLKDRTPTIGICNDLACNSLTVRAICGGNTDQRPAIAIRPDGRPFVYCTSFGGSAAWDCNDANCTTGTSRSVSGSGNSTSAFSYLALDGAGIPVMLYRNDTTGQIFLFRCANINCTSGATTVIATEPSSTVLSEMALAVSAGDRPVVSYQRWITSTNTIERRYLRCADSACSSVNAQTIPSTPRFSSTNPFAFKPAGTASFVETQATGARLILCDGADCTTFTSTTLVVAPQNPISALAATPANLSVLGNGGIGFVGFRNCADAACSSLGTVQTALSSTPQNAARFDAPRMALNADNQAAFVTDEFSGKDVWLALPISDTVFRSGFE